MSTSAVRDPRPEPAIAGLRERADRAATGARPEVWRRYLELEASVDAGTVPVLATVTALLTLDDDADLAHAAATVDHFGHETLARMHLHALRRLGEDDASGLAAALHRRLTRARYGDLPVDLATTCALMATHLVVQDALGATTVTARPIAQRTKLEALLRAWSPGRSRPHVASLLAEPWGPYATRLHAMAVESGDEGIVADLALLVEVARDTVEHNERRQVAEHIRRLIQSTGLPQREFAARVGTSPSRLSTYVSGKVTPSAAMMMRIGRTARGLEVGAALNATA